MAIPDTATHVDRLSTDGGYRPWGLSFLMPTDDWRAYVTRYVPADHLSFSVFGPGNDRPDSCDQTAPGDLAGAATYHRTAYGISNEFTVIRHVYVVAECQPDQAYVSWSYREPRTDRSA